MSISPPTDFLSSKVEELLSRTRFDLADISSDELEDLGYFRVIGMKNESRSSSKSNLDLIIQGRSEPDGEGKPFQIKQSAIAKHLRNTEPKLVYYSSSSSSPSSSSSEIDSDCEINESQQSKHGGMQTNVKTNYKPLKNELKESPFVDVYDQKFNDQKKFHNDFGIRHRSNSASNSGVDKVMKLRSKLNDPANNKLKKTKITKESTATGTQTVRSFLSEQAQNKDKRDTIVMGLNGDNKSKRKASKEYKNVLEKHKNDKEKYKNALEKHKNALEKHKNALEKHKNDKERYKNDNEKYKNDNEKYKNQKDKNDKQNVNKIENKKEPLSWFVPFNKYSNRFSSITNPKVQYESYQPQSLQEAFRINCNIISRRSQLRTRYINLLTEHRKRTAEQRLVAAAKAYQNQKQLGRQVQLPAMKSSVVYQQKRIFTHKEMREQTEKIYVRLPEVVAEKEKKKREEKERVHRLMAEVYKYTLKNYALKGKINWPITQRCLNY